MEIFNKNNFKDENPFLKSIFKKQYDAFFFLNFPPTKDFDGVTSHNIPCWFLNNINQRMIVISNQDNSSVLYFLFHQNWQRQEFIREFNSKLGDSRFLFWNSEKDNWAMVTDSKKEIAIIGIDWQIADQIKLFYKEFLISPLAAIEKLNLSEYEEMFFEKYQPSNILTIGDDKNPLWEKYFFECHVENEDDKLYYWKQFESLYFAVSTALKGFKGIDMYAHQVFERTYFMNKQWYSTYKNAAVGGWQNYSLKNCHKVATKYLANNEHLVNQFDGNYEMAEKLFRENKNGLIRFSDLWIYANIEKQMHKGGSADFYFRINGFSGKTDEVNQLFEFCYNKKLINSEVISNLINNLCKIGKAKYIYKVSQPNKFANYSKSRPLDILGIYGLSLDKKNNKLFEPIEKLCKDNLG